LAASMSHNVAEQSAVPQWYAPLTLFRVVKSALRFFSQLGGIVSNFLQPSIKRSVVAAFGRQRRHVNAIGEIDEVVEQREVLVHAF
jgi:hypothetical protein